MATLKGKPRYAALEDDIRQIMLAKDRMPSVYLQNGELYNFWQSEEHVRGVWRKTSIESYRSSQPEWEILLDLDALAEKESENWVWKGPNCLPPANQPEHPDTALSLNNLALVLRDQGDLAEALQLLERAVAICEKQLGPEHPLTALALNNLARLRQAQGALVEARPLLERVSGQNGLSLVRPILGARGTSRHGAAEYTDALRIYWSHLNRLVRKTLPPGDRAGSVVVGGRYDQPIVVTQGVEQPEQGAPGERPRPQPGVVRGIEPPRCGATVGASGGVSVGAPVLPIPGLSAPGAGIAAGLDLGWCSGCPSVTPRADRRLCPWARVSAASRSGAS